MSKDHNPIPDRSVADNGRWTNRFFLLCVLGACAVSMSSNLADPDLWGHVQYGRDVLKDGFIAPTTTYSFTANGYRWINHENLAEILLAIGSITIGPIGLVFAKFLLSVLVIGLIMRHALRNSVSIMAVALTALLVATNVAFHWSIRPQLLTYTYFTLMVVLLGWCFHGWAGCWHLPVLARWFGNESTDPHTFQYESRRLRYLWLMPVLFFFWANSHGGFVAGLCIYAAYLVLRSIEAVARMGWQSTGLLRRFALMIVVAVLATLINPYGPDLHLWLMNSLGQPRPEITEWAAAELFSFEGMKLWLLIATMGLSLVFTKRSRDLTHTVILAIALWQTLQHMRHAPFLAILFGFWIPMHLDSLLRSFSSAKSASQQLASDLSPLARRLVGAGLICALVLLVGKLSTRLTDLRVERDTYPVSAMQFMAEHDLQGRLVVTYNWAQYAIAAFGGDHDDKRTRVAFDGRFRTCYPQEIVDMHFDFVLGDLGPGHRHRSPNSPPVDEKRVLDFKGPELVLICRTQRNSVRVMQENEENWVLLYQDKLAQLWGLRSHYDQPDHPRYLPPHLRQISDTPQIGSVTWPAFPWRESDEIRSLARGVPQP